MSALSPVVIRLHPRDQVAVALRDLAPGETISAGDASVELRDAVPSGHKVAIAPIATDSASPCGRRAWRSWRRPGNDAASSTTLTVAGATVILFTTGRGTPLGFPAPTLKISTNSRLAEAKPRWIDFDAGGLLGGRSQDEATDALLDLVVETASGRPTRAELNGEREIAIWKRGVTL